MFSLWIKMKDTIQVVEKHMHRFLSFNDTFYVILFKCSILKKIMCVFSLM